MTHLKMAKAAELSAQHAPAPVRDSSVVELDSAALSEVMARSHRREKPRHRFTKLSVLMAVYNEEATLTPCIQAVLAAPLAAGLDREIILVDDGSSDATWTIAQQLAREHPQLRIFQQPRNRGKGAVIRLAISKMTGDLAIFQDADLEYSPSDYTR